MRSIRRIPSLQSVEPLTSGAPVFEGGAFDQREDERFFGARNPGVPLAARNDIVVFERPPLEEDMAVVGPVIVRLWISSDAPDTDFTAKLIDMCPPNSDYPEGFAMNLTDGIFRCRFHKSWGEPEFLESGRIYEIEIEPFATANLFKRGHRIRLDISSSNFPHFDVNPNSGESPALARAPRIAVNTVYMGADNPSHLVLPLVPVNALRGLEALAAHNSAVRPVLAGKPLKPVQRRPLHRAPGTTVARIFSCIKPAAKLKAINYRGRIMHKHTPRAILAASVGLGFIATTAHAQSTVTLYGIVDGGFTYTSNQGGKSNYQATAGSEQGSRWGLIGKEDLGGGNAAIFRLENGFNLQTGVASANGPHGSGARRGSGCPATNGAQ